MRDRPIPYDVKRTIALLRGDISRPWRIPELARFCGVGRRTLEKHFRAFAQCTPLEFLQAERLELARRKLVRASPGTRVADIAVGCGFNHLGRFSLAYRNRFGESPSATLRHARISIFDAPRLYRGMPPVDRPTIAILPFDVIETEARFGSDLHHEIAVAFSRTGWARIVPSPAGRYHLHGTLRVDGSGKLRVRAMLLDRSHSSYIWADSWECAAGDLVRQEEWLSGAVANMLRTIVRDAEIADASWQEPERLTAWQLTMRAMPMVLAADPAAHGRAIDLLHRAIELSPRTRLPVALAAFCHGLRAAHHFTKNPDAEREAALCLAARASAPGVADPIAEVMLSGASALVRDFAAAEAHARQALAIDGGSAWAWGRLGWVHAYRGECAEAIECCQIARALSPADPLHFLWSIAIASSHFECYRYSDAVRWYRRAREEGPKAVWIDRYLAPACVLAGDMDEGRRTFEVVRHRFPDLTIGQMRSGVPNSSQWLDRLAEGLESLGMPLS